MAQKTLAGLFICCTLAGCATTAPNFSSTSPPINGGSNTKAEQLAWSSNECVAIFVIMKGASMASKNQNPSNVQSFTSMTHSFVEMSIGLVGVDRSKEMVKIAVAKEKARLENALSGQSDAYVKYLDTKASACVETAQQVRAYIGVKPVNQKTSAAAS